MTLLYCWWLTSMVAADWTSEVGGLALSQVELDAEAEAALVDCPRSTAAFVSDTAEAFVGVEAGG